MYGSATFCDSFMGFLGSMCRNVVIVITRCVSLSGTYIHNVEDDVMIKICRKMQPQIEVNLHDVLVVCM